MMWDLCWYSLKEFGFFGDILLTGFCRGFSKCIHIINLYTPYSNKLQFWERLDRCGFLDLRNTILVGEFNVALKVDDIWGVKGRPDPNAEEIGDILIQVAMMDIKLENNSPT